MCLDPSPDGGVLVRGVVARDHMHVQSREHSRRHGSAKPGPFERPLALMGVR